MIGRRGEIKKPSTAARGRSAPARRIVELPGSESGPPVTEEAGEPGRSLLRMVGQFLVAQAPILPELKRT